MKIHLPVDDKGQEGGGGGQPSGKAGAATPKKTDKAPPCGGGSPAARGEYLFDRAAGLTGIPRRISLSRSFKGENPLSKSILYDGPLLVKSMYFLL